MQGVREKGWQGVRLGSRGSDDASGSSAFCVPFAPSSLLPSLLSPSFLRDPVVPPLALLPPSLHRILSRNIHPRWGKQGRSNVCRCSKLPWILHGDALETGNRVRDSRHVRGCSCICNKFRVSFHSRFSFPIVRCVESRFSERKLRIVCGAKYTASRQRQ